MRQPIKPLNHADERPITIPEMIRRWGADSAIVILQSIATTGNPHFGVVRGSWSDNYVLVLDLEVNDTPMLPSVLS